MVRFGGAKRLPGLWVGLAILWLGLKETERGISRDLIDRQFLSRRLERDEIGTATILPEDVPI